MSDSITALSIPAFKTDDCNPANITCSGTVTDTSPAGFKIVFPDQVGQTLPLSGGAIISIDVTGLKFLDYNDTRLALDVELNPILDLALTKDLASLEKLRNYVNKSLYELKDYKILSNNTKTDSPKIFLSSLEGDDSDLDEKSASSSVNKICSFKYIPFSFFQTVLDKVTKFGAFSELIGASGKSFAELNDLIKPVAPTEDSVIRFCLEFFTIFNLSEDLVLKKSNDSAIGGFYTVVNDTIYLKTPDISLKDSASYSAFTYSGEFNFYIEFTHKREFKRYTFSDWSAPITATLYENEFEYSEFTSLEFQLETSYAASDIKNVYLSLIAKDASIPKNKFVNTYADTIEVVTVPLLSSNDQFGDLFKSTETVEFSLADAESTFAKYFKSTVGFTTYNMEMPQSVSKQSAENFFGEKNRPECLLTSNKKLSSDSKNDSKFFSQKSSGSLPLLSNIRSRTYSKVPTTWIKASSVSTSSDEGFIDVSVLAFNFANINFDALSSSAQFAIYTEDSIGQISRVAGNPLYVAVGVPYIKSVSPTGCQNSAPILVDATDTTLFFVGENLSNAVGISIKIENSTNTFITLFGSTENLVYTKGDKASQLAFASDLFQFGFDVNSKCQLAFVSPSNDVSNYVELYISQTSDDDKPECSSPSLEFKENEFKIAGFGADGPYGIPLLTDGSSATIKIKSKQAVFSGDFPIYAYIATPDISIAQTIVGDAYLTLTGGITPIYVLKSVNYTLSNSILSDFYHNLFNRSAYLKFPGTHAKVNLQPLATSPIQYLIITTDFIDSLVAGSATLEISTKTMGVIQLGSAQNFAFVNPTFVKDMIAELPGSANYIATNTISSASFIEKKPIVGEISILENINKFGIAFEAVKQPNFLDKIDFYIGTKKINIHRDGKFEKLYGNTYLAKFSNITISEDGYLPVYVKVKNRVFKCTTSSDSVKNFASLLLASDQFSIGDTGLLTTSVEVKEILPKVEKILSDFIKNGVLTNPTDPDFFSFFSPLKITPNFSARVAGLDTSQNNLTLLPQSATTEVSLLTKTVLSVDANSLFTDYAETSTGAMAYLNMLFSNHCVIKSNIPEVYQIKLDPSAQTALDIASVNGDDIKAGMDIVLFVRNAKKNFKILFNGKPLKPKTKAREVIGQPTGTYEVIVTVPHSLFGSDCVNLCVSVVNEKRLGAAYHLGEAFVHDAALKMQETLFGRIKDSLPNVDDLKDLIKKFPLRLANLKLDTSLVPIELINSFCDFSWHLCADLKLALNGFQMLMVPIQVILCIIDVICSLLHPGKIASSVVRLFYCIYDLLLLLPQISIPVMFLQLILHLLKLLECIILKILEIVKAINEIINVIDLAAQGEVWGALKGLEEILTEYVLQFNIDIDILEPIISILAIFLELLALVFNLPCTPTDALSEASCGIEGTLLAGWAIDKIAPDQGAYDPSVLLPFAQFYTTNKVEDVAAAGTGSSYIEFTPGDNISSQGSGATFLDGMTISDETLRTTNGTAYQASFVASVTKSTRSLLRPTYVKFKFKSRADNSGLFKKRIIEPEQNLDSPLHLLNIDGSTLEVATTKGNFFSMMDGAEFLNVYDDGTADVKKLTLTFDIPIYEANSETGEIEQTGSESVTRTFDEIPKMTLLDEEGNMYFVREKGIHFNDDNEIDEIETQIVNAMTAPALRFNTENEDIDTDADDVADDEARIFSFPQLFFFDMRSLSDRIQERCYSASINDFLLNNENEASDIADVVQDGMNCVTSFRDAMKSLVNGTLETLQSGKIPELLDVDSIATSFDSLRQCLQDSANKMCSYATNSLNTSFLLVDDSVKSANAAFPDAIFDPASDSLVGFSTSGPALTGAREFAAGIGDSLSLGIGKKAKFKITIRDSYDIVIDGDFTDNIAVEITQDDTGAADFVEQENGKNIIKIDDSYYGEVQSEVAGLVKIRASVCSRTIQAVTYSGADTAGTTAIPSEEGCVPKLGTDAVAPSIALGSLTKVDRILTIFFVDVDRAVTVLSGTDNNILTLPQEFSSAVGEIL